MRVYYVLVDFLWFLHFVTKQIFIHKLNQK